MAKSIMAIMRHFFIGLVIAGIGVGCENGGSSTPMQWRLAELPSAYLNNVGESVKITCVDGQLLVVLAKEANEELPATPVILAPRIANFDIGDFDLGDRTVIWRQKRGLTLLSPRGRTRWCVIPHSTERALVVGSILSGGPCFRLSDYSVSREGKRNGLLGLYYFERFPYPDRKTIGYGYATGLLSIEGQLRGLVNLGDVAAFSKCNRMVYVTCTEKTREWDEPVELGQGHSPVFVEGQEALYTVYAGVQRIPGLSHPLLLSELTDTGLGNTVRLPARVPDPVWLNVCQDPKGRVCLHWVYGGKAWYTVGSPDLKKWTTIQQFDTGEHEAKSLSMVFHESELVLALVDSEGLLYLGSMDAADLPEPTEPVKPL